MKFSERLRYLIVENNISNSEFAEKIGYGKTAVYYWLNNKREPTANALSAIAKFFDVSADYLLGLEDDFGSKAEKNAIKKIPSEDFTTEEIEMIKKIRLLGPYEQTYIKAQIDALTDTQKSKQKEKIKK